MRAVTRKTILLAGTALVSLPAWALAEPPAALDRVPMNAIVAIGVKSIESFDARIGKLLDEMKIGEDGQMANARSLMKTPGLNPKGSVAVAVFADPNEGKPKDAKAKDAKPKAAAEDEMDDEGDEGGEPPAVLIVPVSDYAAFVKHFGATDPKGVVELTAPAGEDAPFDGEMYAKDIGGGYAALSPKKDLVEKFDGKGGNMAAHTKALGKVGARISDTSETIVVANIPALAGKIREGVAKAKEQMKQMAAMGGQGQNIEGASKLMEVVSEGFLKDAQVGIIGLGLDEGGIWIDIGAQFKEGSEVGNFFKGNGSASNNTAKLPDQPFLFAYGVDTSDAGIKKLIKNASELMTPKEDAKGGDALGMMKNIIAKLDEIGGGSMIVGQSPGGFTGGLLANSSVYIATSNPTGYTGLMKEMATSMNGKTIEGMTYNSTYESAAVDIGGVKVDKYSSSIQIDPNAENAMQVQQAQMMMFGSAGGVNGYTAIVEKGVVTTLAPSKNLMTAALDAAKGNKNLGANKDIKDVAARLPANRSLEMYIGVKSILEMAAPFMGGKPVPASLPPIGIGATTNESGTHLRIFVPTAVVTTLKSTFGGQGEEAEPAPAEKAEKPRF